MCNKCCDCWKRFFCMCCCCCNRRRKNNVDENEGRKKVISTVSEIVPDSDNESVYNGSSTYEVPLSGRENAKSFSDSGISAMYVPGLSMQSGESAASILKKTVLTDAQTPIQCLTHALALSMEVKGVITLGGVEQEIQGMLKIGNKEENVITTQPRSVFAVNKNVTTPSRDSDISYSNLEFNPPKPITKSLSMSNRPPIPLPRQKDIGIPGLTVDTPTPSEEEIEEDGHYMVPISLPIEELPPPLPAKQKRRQFKDNANSYLSVYDDVPIGPGAVREAEIIPTIIIDNEITENDVVLRKKKTELDEVADDHIYEDIEIVTRY